ncbi:hypothetical protein JH06_5756 [Blastocystis sp. subtype 4]|uniref:hypothetical protein n=1 Tax=Blastocystis sp. subtype 4 TaxID=944170 RepID=UPI000711E5EA|nr:hypothetical protein JH06_5756 [Blastocystis sp. subtype 4]KNB41266.1 hypothetical protein JH06_5756 [Blastocystis sp. subtype 4]|eukprot:XP_014524709.1 hypothetical protein JH06_5756 [Blastocystis sp. subtype 4]
MTRYTVNNRNTLLSIPWDVTALTVTANSCNDNTINVVDLSSFKFVRSVVIGDSLGLNWLESVSIGSSSFGGTGSLWKGSELKIVNCPQLKSLSIRAVSFVRYNWFELSELPQLKSVVMTSNAYHGCFRYACNAVFRDLPSLETIDLGDGAFQYAEYELNISDLPKLTVLLLQTWCLEGSTSTKTIDVIPYYYKNTLIMRSIDDVFENMGFVRLESITFGSIKQ